MNSFRAICMLALLAAHAVLAVAAEPTTTSLMTAPNPSTVGQTVTLTATVSPANATGFVAFYDNGGFPFLGPVRLVNGSAAATTSALTPGTHMLTASYGGDLNYLGSQSNTVNQVVNKTSTIISFATSPNPSSFGQTVMLTANVSPADATGTVNFFDGLGVAGIAIASASVSNGVASVGVSALAIGTHKLTASYGGDLNYSGSSSNTVNQTVSQPTPTITLMTSGSPSIVNNPVTLTANVSGASGTPTGNVSFFDGNSLFPFLGPVSLSNGTASAQTTALTAGMHLLKAHYGGDLTYQGGDSATIPQTVQNATTTSLKAVPASSTAGQNVVLTAAVLPSTAAGFVTFLDGSTIIGAAPLNAGTANFSTSSLSVGSHSLTASYGGDTNDAPSVSSAVLETVNQIATTTSLQAVPASSIAGSGQTVVLTAGISPSTATGTVTFLDGLTIIGAAQLSAGTAILSTSSLSAGSHSLTASYGGDTNDAPSVSSPVTETVNRIVTTTSLLAAPASSSLGQTVALTAAVSPSITTTAVALAAGAQDPCPSCSPATGTVTFLDGETIIGTAPLKAGIANFSTSTLSLGSHSLGASYSGDTNDAPSVSPPVTETVNQIATTTSLKAVPASSNPGQTLALTATVSPATPITGECVTCSPATGTVTFLDAAANGTCGTCSTTIGAAPLIAGQAIFSISTLSMGSHSLTASYGGDTNDAPSVSPPVTESVGQLTTATTLAAAPNPSVFGQNVTLTATVKPGNPTGTVSFFDLATSMCVTCGANLLGTAFLANGVAAYSTSTLSAGSHSLTASYSGDTNNAPSTSAAVNEPVTGGTGPVAPNPVAGSPASGSGPSQVMSFTFNNPRGWQDLDVVNILINNVLDGRNACYLAYSRSAGVLYLVADDGGTLSTGLALGGPGSVSNSQCSVAGAASMVAGSRDTLTVTLNIVFTSGFGGNKVVYLAARDLEGGNSGWQALGVWQPPFTPSGTIAVVSLTPARGAAPSGTAQTFAATLTDSQGGTCGTCSSTAGFGVVNLLVGNFIDGRSACYLAYVASTNSLLLVDDGGDAGGPFAGGMVLNGAAGAIQNSQCSVNGVGSSAAKSGNTLTLTLNITFKSPFAGNLIVWVAGRDQASGNNTDWQAMGTTTVQ